MFPDIVFLGLDLYNYCILAGIVLAVIVARVYADLLKIPVKLQNLIYITAIFALAGGFGGAIFFQSVYNWIETGAFEWDGMTFYGGLICGVLIFLAGYFLIGKKVCRDLPVKYFGKVAGLGACALSIAHCIGRLGCFFAGCCYGRVTDAWYGIYMPAVGEKVIPTQLIECIFLFLLFIALSVLLFKTEIPVLGVYLTVYAIFRFCIEFLRGDDRGQFVKFLTPSQFWSVLLFLAGTAVIARHIIKRRKAKRMQNEA